LPRLAEVAVMAEIANVFAKEGQVNKYEEWIDRAIFDAAGKKSVQDFLRSRRDKGSVDPQRILGWPARETLPDGGSEKVEERATEEDIRRNAYFKWLAAGEPSGDDVKFWLQAQNEFAADTK
jgi:Protein of unknown function (DUF2934)